MDTDGKVRFPDPTGNGSEFLFRRRVQQRLLRASASLRENRLFLLSFSIPTSPSRSPAEAQGCGELSVFFMETGRFPPSVFNGVEKSAAQRGKRWQVIFRILKTRTKKTKWTDSSTKGPNEIPILVNPIKNLSYPSWIWTWDVEISKGSFLAVFWGEMG